MSLLLEQRGTSLATYLFLPTGFPFRLLLDTVDHQKLLQNTLLILISTRVMAAKNVMERLKECKDLVIQNLERTMRIQMVFKFLQTNIQDSESIVITINGKDGTVKLGFKDHERAMKFYWEYNFGKETILIRPLNIYFNLHLSEEEMKKVYLEGITQENQRAIFDECIKFGVCKFYYNYGSGTMGKLRETGFVSYIRKEVLSDDEFKRLCDSLAAIKVKCSHYVVEKGVKCSVQLSNFYTGDVKSEEEDIKRMAEEEIRKIVTPLLSSPIEQISIKTKYKDAVLGQKPEPSKVLVIAYIEFKDLNSTLANNQAMRVAFLHKEIRSVLFYHKDDNYCCLFSNNLVKKNPLINDKEFEQELLDCAKKINAEVTQVLVFPIKVNETYIGKFYFKSPEGGKNFIVNYCNHRLSLLPFYNQKQISFDINVSKKTISKFKNAKTKAGDMNSNLKRMDEFKKRTVGRQQMANNFPINYTNLPPNMIGHFAPVAMSNMPPNMSNMPPNMVNMANPSIANMPMMPNQPPPMMMGGMIPPMQFQGSKLASLPPPQGENMWMKVQQYLADKAGILAMDLQKCKHFTFYYLKFLVEEQGVPSSESSAIANKLLMNADSTAMIFRYIEFPEEIKKKIPKQ